ncbi:MAG: hypothetical protein HUU35_14130 [Armatimonadetes bacterium]|nr:hypothetical protein [Armatimonadota bacterium]
MGTEMTSRERFQRVYAHQEPDRVPLHDSFWAATLERWQAEGLPRGVSPATFFEFDRIAGIACDNSPRFPETVVEETPEYRIVTTRWGVTQRTWTHRASVPEFLDFTVVDRDSWEVAKARMTPSEERLDWAALERNYPIWRAQGAWLIGGGWFGFDVLHSWFVGTERVLMAMVTDPDWVRDMIETMLDLNLALLELAWDRGYTFDCLRWPDDLAFVKGPFFSPEIYRAVVQPAHRRACDWAHNRGIPAMLHTDGNIWPLLPDLLDAGIDALNPLEQKAGMDVARLKAEVGDKLVLEGGIDVRQMGKPEIEETIRGVFEAAKPGGGYIYHSDHSVPADISFADYCRVIALVKHYGKY